MMSKLFASITTTDSYMLWIALFTLTILGYCLWRSRIINKHIEEWKTTKNLSTSRLVYNDLAVTYNLFITLISIFPLLGMFGTVMGLLGVDFSAGSMDNIKANFFIALTSTAWGIIFSIIFKIINSLCSTSIETKIKEAKKIAELTGVKVKMRSR